MQDQQSHLRGLDKSTMRFGLVFLSLISLFVSTGFGCTQITVIWAKSPKSDTPLFRFARSGGEGSYRDYIGYIDRHGNVAIPTIFESFGNYGGDFFEGVTPVRLPTPEGPREGYLGESGEIVIEPQFRSASDFSEGLAAVRFSLPGKWGFIDETGQFVISPRFHSVGSFSSGRAVFTLEIGDKKGYIDRTGKVVISARFLRAHPFSEDRAAVIEQGPCWMWTEGPCGGLTQLPSRGHYRERDANDTGMSLPRCEYTYIDPFGERVGDLVFHGAGNFSDGLARVAVAKADNSLYPPDAWGYVDLSGQIAIPAQFESAKDFSEGLACVRRDRLWGFIDRSGEYAIPPKFEFADDFSQGLAVVGDGSGSWFVDETGERAFPGVFKRATRFVLGLAHVQLEGGSGAEPEWAYIDRNGEKVFRYSLDSELIQ